MILRFVIFSCRFSVIRSDALYSKNQGRFIATLKRIEFIFAILERDLDLVGRAVAKVPLSGKSARAAHHGLQIIIGLDDLDQAVFGGTVAAIGVGMMLLHQRLVFRLDGFERGIGTEPHHLERLALGVEYFPGFDLGLGARTGPPAAAAIEFAKHAEGIGGAFEIGLGTALALFGAGIGAHLPGRTMTGQRVLLVPRNRIRVHAGKEIVGLVVFADVIEAEVPIFLVVGAALGRAMRPLVLAVGPFAHGGCFTRLGLLLRAQLVGLDTDGVEEF
jgi:hypothetical protein